MYTLENAEKSGYTIIMEFKKDPRSALELLRFHKRARRRSPYAQVLLLCILVPVLHLLSRIRVHGLKNIPDGGFIVVANHPSVLDPFFVLIPLCRRLFFMGKSELFSGLRGRLYTWVGGFPVRRGVWDIDAFNTASQVVSRGKVFCMFPEGGVSPKGEYGSTKPGVGYITLLSGAPVLPIHLAGSDKLRRRWYSWPRVCMRIGEPLHFSQSDNPTREQSQQVSDLIMKAIVELDA